MANQIVVVEISQQVAPAPNRLQQTGALVSQGATLTAPGTVSLLTQLSDLTPLLTGAKAITGITQSSGLATAVCAAAHGFTIGDTILITIAGAAYGAYNGTFLCTITTTTHFTYAVPSATHSPDGGASIVYTVEDVAELLEMATTFFAQGSNVSVYVLELGAGNANDGVTFLSNWITLNPGFFYSYLVPRTWDGESSYLNMLAEFESTTSMTYFFTTTTLASYTDYNDRMKCALTLVESPEYSQWPVNALSAIAYTAGWAANVFTALAWALGEATATTTTNHGILPGQTFTVSGCVPTVYNGTFVALTGTATDSLVYALATNPGSATTLGQVNASAGGSVTATTTTNHGVAVGEWFTIVGCVPIAYNGTFQAQLGTTGEYLVYNVPDTIGSETVLGSLLASYWNSSGVASTEFSLASVFWKTLSYQPSVTNQVPPLNLSFVSGVTPYPTQGNSAILTKLGLASVNTIGTGAEGGISNTLIDNGVTQDGNPFNYWYAADWGSINLNLNVSNAVINGSNNPTNPLYYNQAGINALQKVAQAVMNSGVSFGLFLGPVYVSAVPFNTYIAASPSDYADGRYAGLSCTATPQRGFGQIIFNLVINNFGTA